MFYKNYCVITRNDTNEEKVRTNFDDFHIGNDYIIIDRDLISTYIGREICDDLEQDGIYFDEDVIARIEEVTDNINNILYEEVKEYLDNNFPFKR